LAEALFVVARNPQGDSRLPYLLRLPLPDGLVLKARECWPATARVYCHRFEEPWPDDAEVLERTPVRLCAGAAPRSTSCSRGHGSRARSSSSRK
jgi:hypothetical protein